MTVCPCEPAISHFPVWPAQPLLPSQKFMHQTTLPSANIYLRRGRDQGHETGGGGDSRPRPVQYRVYLPWSDYLHDGNWAGDRATEGLSPGKEEVTTGLADKEWLKSSLVLSRTRSCWELWRKGEAVVLAGGARGTVAGSTGWGHQGQLGR